MPSVSQAQELEVMDCWTDGVSNHLARDIYNGLTSEKKSIPSKYFYDQQGSKLFDRICRLPEYYVTRVEMALLRNKAHLIMNGFDRGDIVELGSGANWKIRTLLESLSRETRSRSRYVPVDVSEKAILEAGGELLKIYPELNVMGVVADFTRDLHQIPESGPKLVLFLGSTIGNFSHEDGASFLRVVSDCLRPGDRFLLGMDMVKPTDILEAAYNDAQGVTAEFNKNVLRVVNRELGANFRLDRFDHVAFFNEDREQVEMHLRANKELHVEIPGIDLTVAFEEGETIHTEISRKFSRESARNMVEEAGLEIAHWHADPKEWFALAELVRPNLQ